MLSHKKRKRVQTTDSDHCFYKYPNRAKNLVPKRANLLWVADVTYISMGSVFVNLPVIMELIPARLLDGTWTKPWKSEARYAPLKWRCKRGQKLVEHCSIIAPATRSDPGVQYCSWKYVDMLRNNDITISMTQSGDLNKNAMAERVFRTLKEDFGLRGFVSFSSAQATVEKAINHYNAIRPHASLEYLTPNQAHLRSGPLPLKWYPYKKIRFCNVHCQSEYIKTG